MPQAILPSALDERDPRRIRWTRADCDRFEREGLLAPGRYELVEGDVRKKMGQNYPHLLALNLLVGWLLSRFGSERIINQGTIDIDAESAPEPDAAVLYAPLRTLGRLPQAIDILLAIEVSDTTLRFDLGPKSRVYARSGIPEYWVLDIEGRRLHVHREPVGDRYGALALYDEDEQVAPLAAPEHPILVAELLPPAVTEEQP